MATDENDYSLARQKNVELTNNKTRVNLNMMNELLK